MATAPARPDPNSEALRLGFSILARKRAYDAAKALGDNAAMQAAHQAADALREHLRVQGYPEMAAASENLSADAFALYLAAWRPSDGDGTIEPVPPGVILDPIVTIPGGETATPPAADPILGALPGAVGGILTGAGNAVGTAWAWGTANWRTISLLIGIFVLGKMLKVKLNLGGGR